MRLNLYRVIACGRCGMGVVGRCRGTSAWVLGACWCVSGRPLERVGVEGETPVRENMLGVSDGVPRVAASSWNLL
jgi:hypothetical protein